MSPVAVWTLVAAIGVLASTANLWNAVSDVRAARRDDWNGLRLLVTKQDVVINGLFLFGCLAMGSLGVEYILAGQGVGGTWTRGTITILVAVSLLVAGALVSYAGRVKLNRSIRDERNQQEEE